jgi:folate-binding protein YgfZ
MTVTDEKNQQLIEFFESMGYSSYAINGYKIINRYSDQEIELDAMYTGVALRNISHQGIIELKGKDALDLVHRIATNNVKNLPKEGVRSTIFTTEKGRIISVATLMNFENYQILVCDRTNKIKVMSWLRKYVINDDVEVNDANAKYNLLELSGPQAESFATLICGNIISEIQPGTFRIVHTENILFFVIKLPGERNKNKFWFLADFENSKRLINYMNENKGVFNFSMIGEEAYNIYRVEHGLPTSPNELSDEYNPLEAGLIDLVDFEKGCYIGQEVIARLQNYNKVQKRLAGVMFNQLIDNSNGLLILEENGNEVGKVTSYVYSQKLKKPIGLVYIRNNFIKPGTQLLLKYSEDKPVNAEVVYPLPFIK